MTLPTRALQRTKQLPAALVSRALARVGYVRSGSAPAVSGSIDAASTVAAARASGRSVSEHVEALWGHASATSRVIEDMRGLGLSRTHVFRRV